MWLECFLHNLTTSHDNDNSSLQKIAQLCCCQNVYMKGLMKDDTWSVTGTTLVCLRDDRVNIRHRTSPSLHLKSEGKLLGCLLKLLCWHQRDADSMTATWSTAWMNRDEKPKTAQQSHDNSRSTLCCRLLISCAKVWLTRHTVKACLDGAVGSVAGRAAWLRWTVSLHSRCQPDHCVGLSRHMLWD